MDYMLYISPQQCAWKQDVDDPTDGEFVGQFINDVQENILYPRIESLQLNTANSFTPDISAATYDHALLQYSGGALKQKDLRPANATFYAAWSSVLDGNWGGGTLTGTAFNGAAISGGYLDLTGAVANRYVEFSAISNADSLQVGAVKFKVTPNYSGTPSQYQIFFTAFTTAGVNTNNIELYHEPTTGNIHILIVSGTGTNIVTANLGAWSPVSGTEYEMELNWDITTGATRLFINGVQLGSTATGTGTRTAPINFFRIGTEYILSPGIVNPNFKIRQMIIFNAVQHTANYTPGYSYSPTIYADAIADLPLFTYGGGGTFPGFASFIAVDSGTPHYTLNGKYWNGSAWVASDSSYAQSSSAATVNSNIGALSVSSTLQVDVIYQASNSVQESITSLTMGYGSRSINFAVANLQTQWVYLIAKIIGSAKIVTTGKDTDGSTDITATLRGYGTEHFPGFIVLSTYNVTAINISSTSDGTTIDLFAGIACADNDARLTTNA